MSYEGLVTGHERYFRIAKKLIVILRLKAWSEQQPPQSFYLSTVTLAEIRFGIEQVQAEEFRRELNEWLDGTLRPWFCDRLLGISEDVKF